MGLGRKEEGAAATVLLSLRLEMHGLTFSFCFLYFKRAVLIRAQLGRWWWAKKGLKARGGSEQHVPTLDLGKPDFLNCCRRAQGCSLDYESWNCGIC